MDTHPAILVEKALFSQVNRFTIIVHELGVKQGSFWLPDVTKMSLICQNQGLAHGLSAVKVANVGWNILSHIMRFLFIYTFPRLA